MDISNFTQFLQRLGYKIYKSESSYWADMGSRFFLVSLPYNLEISPTEKELSGLFHDSKALGVKFNQKINNLNERSNLFGGIYLNSGSVYDLSIFRSKDRNKLKKAISNCEVKQISPVTIKNKAPDIIRDTLKRQQRGEAIFDNGYGWDKISKAIVSTGGAEVWGSFINKELAAFLIAFQIDGVSNILYSFSSSELLKYRSNDALGYIFTKEKLSSSNVNTVSYGLEGLIPNAGLDKFKTRLGYVKKPLAFSVKLNWKLNFLSKFNLPKIITLTGNKARSDSLLKLGYLLEIASNSK